MDRLDNVIFKPSWHCVCDQIILLKISLATYMVLPCGRRGGLMVSELDSGSSGLGSSPGRGHCVVLLGKTHNSHSASLHPGV